MIAATNGPVGLLGGTFDPIHFGHLRLAQELGEALNFSEVRVIPSGSPPHRPAPYASSAHRLAMVKLAIDGNPLLTIDEREISRSGPCYTIDTLIELRHQLGATRPLCLLLGADAFLDLVTWHRWHELFHFAHLIVACRPGFPVQTWSQRMPQPLAREYEARHMEQPLAVHLSPAGGIVGQPLAALDIAATRLRQLVRMGRSPRYLLPDSVLDYILSNGIYYGSE